MNNDLVSKVLVLDSSTQSETIRKFCHENKLVALTVDKKNLMSVLDSHIDLGAILYSENFADTEEETAEIAHMIHAARPELPIILRRNAIATLDDISEDVRWVYCAAYVASDMAALGKVIDECLFNLVYPNALLRGIAEITQGALSSQFRTCALEVDTPYIVRDRFMFGKVYSLIPIESAWCRGYMMLQTEEAPILDLLERRAQPGRVVNFRDVNSQLGEVTNLIWGAFKSHFIGDAAAAATSAIQVPLVVNQEHQYISFGTENPELCFRYTLTDTGTRSSFSVYQRFCFNLLWMPEDFREDVRDFAVLVDAGKLYTF